MDNPLPRVFADNPTKEDAIETAKVLGAIAGGVTLFIVLQASLYAAGGTRYNIGGA